ncbi:hypothetical protein ACFE04_012331 [Oxalis oulophora]
MGVFVFEDEITTTVSPARVFNSFVNADVVFLKVAAEHIKSVETLEGDGGVGTIRKIVFHEGHGGFIKQKIEVIDKANLQYNDSVIEGDAIVGSIEKILNENKIIPNADGGSIVKSKSTFYTTDETEIPVQILTEGKEKRLGMFKATEAYLLANPDAFN